MSDSVRPHRGQPTRLPHPWDSLGKNIGVGCHFLLQCMKVKSESEVAQSCPILSDPMDCRLLCPWDFPGKSTGVGCHCLLHPCVAGRFLTARPPGEFHELPRFSICQNLKIFLQKPNQKSVTISNLHALCKSLTNESCLIFFV